jgi:hypothetical protein
MIKEGRPFCDDCGREMLALDDDEVEEYCPAAGGFPWERACKHYCTPCADKLWQPPCETECQTQPCERGRECWWHPQLHVWPYETYFAPRLKFAVFRVRRVYFKQLAAMVKNVELRKDSEFWRKRLLAPKEYQPRIALFLCGPRKLYRRIVEIRANQDPEAVLGRPLSAQGKKDIPTGKCIAIYLGEVVAGAKGSSSLK